MLGRLRRTTRLDVGLAFAFATTAYVVWALVAGMSRDSVQDLVRTIAATEVALPLATANVKTMFVDYGIAIDLVGVAWILLSQTLLVFSSRQYLGISWVWVSAISQSFAAAVGAVLVGWAVQLPYANLITRPDSLPEPTAMEKISGLSLPMAIVVALVLSVGFLVWLLVDQIRLSRRGPSLRDGLRSNR